MNAGTRIELGQFVLVSETLSTAMAERGDVSTGDSSAEKSTSSLLCTTVQMGRRIQKKMLQGGVRNLRLRHRHETRDLVSLLLLCIAFHLQFWTGIVEVRASDSDNTGRWNITVENGGISAMHMTVTHQSTLVYFDMTNAGGSLMQLPDGHCAVTENDGEDCWAHAAEYTIGSQDIRPLEVKTNPWCSSGSFVKNGTLIQTGGWNDGYKVVRYFDPCASGESCDWIEAPDGLQEKRWYASNQILPDDRQVVVGGRAVSTYEFIPRRREDEGTYKLSLLTDTHEKGAENNLYPFVYLSSDGNLFVFANRDSILLNLETNEVVREFPRMPGRGSRNYPSSGSSVILPLTYEDNFQKVEVMVCGGSPPNAYQQAKKEKNFLTALDTCGRLVITDDDPQWKMETMPGPRVLSDMLILPTGDVLVINGCSQGTGGWGLGRSPVLTPYLYTPSDSQWQILAESTIPRMYHSAAVLIPDGRVLVAGSNTNRHYNLSTDIAFPTEVRIEAFSPPYLHESQRNLRPSRVAGPVHQGADPERLILHYGEEFTVFFHMPHSGRDKSVFEYRLNAPPFCTHSFSQNQRQLVLEATTSGDGRLKGARIRAPPSPVVAPSGYYIFFVVHKGVPSTGIWVQLLPTDELSNSS